MSSSSQQQQQNLEHDDSQSSFSIQETASGMLDGESSSSSSVQQHAPFFYSMQVGSVDAFERKVDEAQRALKRSGRPMVVCCVFMCNKERERK